MQPRNLVKVKVFKELISSAKTETFRISFFVEIKSKYNSSNLIAVYLNEYLSNTNILFW